MHLRISALAILGTLCLYACRAEVQEPSQQLEKSEHLIPREGQKISLLERTLGGGQRPVIVLVHGATWSSGPDFDLQIRDYSVMDAFARKGFDTFAVDVQGYGKSDDPIGDNWSRTADAVADLDAAIEWIRRERGVEKVDLLGWSWGAQITGLYANQHPKRVKRLVLLGFTWGKDRPKREAPTEKYRTNDAEGAASDFIEGCYEQDVVDLYVRECLKADPVTPNGVLVDFSQHLPLVDPTKLTMPVMLIYGEHEVDEERLADGTAFYQKLGHPERSIVVIGGGGHAVLLEKPRLRWQKTVLGFFSD